MSNEIDLKSLLDEAKAKSPGAKLFIHFAGGREEEFNLNEWNYRDATGLPNHEYRIWIFNKIDKSEERWVVFFNVTLVRFEFF